MNSCVHEGCIFAILHASSYSYIYFCMGFLAVLCWVYSFLLVTC
eukprot:UN22743